MATRAALRVVENPRRAGRGEVGGDRAAGPQLGARGNRAELLCVAQEGGLRGRGIERDGDVFVDDAPGRLVARVGDGHADPAASRRFTGLGVDQALEAVHDGEVAADVDRQVAHFGAEARRKEIEHGLPRAAIGGGAAMLMRRDSIEEEDVRRVVLHQSIKVAGAKGDAPLIDELPNLGLVGGGVGRGHGQG